jgi:hypothetical protein
MTAICKKGEENKYSPSIVQADCIEREREFPSSVWGELRHSLEISCINRLKWKSLSMGIDAGKYLSDSDVHI